MPPGLPSQPLFAGLAAYPFFVYFMPGEPVIPLSPFAPAVAVAGALRCHCRYDDALRWYERYYDPFISDNAWHGASPPPPVARRRSVLLEVLETLMCWGDAVMAAHDDCGREAGNAPEAFAQARVDLRRRGADPRRDPANRAPRAARAAPADRRRLQPPAGTAQPAADDAVPARR